MCGILVDPGKLSRFLRITPLCLWMFAVVSLFVKPKMWPNSPSSPLSVAARLAAPNMLGGNSSTRSFNFTFILPANLQFSNIGGASNSDSASAERLKRHFKLYCQNDELKCTNAVATGFFCYLGLFSRFMCTLMQQFFGG